MILTGSGASLIIVIVISKLPKRYSKAKRTRAPPNSQALRRIKGGSRGESKEAQVRFPECHEGTEELLQYNAIQLSIYIALEQEQVLHDNALCYILSRSTRNRWVFNFDLNWATDVP